MHGSPSSGPTVAGHDPPPLHFAPFPHLSHFSCSMKSSPCCSCCLADEVQGPNATFCLVLSLVLSAQAAIDSAGSIV